MNPLTSKVYPDGSSVHYAYDGAGRTVGISDPFGETTRFVYDGAGRRVQKLGTQGHRTEYGYDPGTGWLTGVTSWAATGSVASAFTYPVHDDVGNRLSMTETGGGSTSYSYDALDRLATLDPPNESIYPANGALTHFAYDAAGNRTDFGPKSGSSFVSPHTTYTYNALQKRLTAIKVDGVTVESLGSYDANGNPGTWTPPGGSARTLKFDALGRLVEISGGFSASYVYDPFGRRIEKTEQGVTTRYQYDGLDVVAEYSASQLEATYVFGPGIDEVLKLKRGTTVAAYHTDGLGSVASITDATNGGSLRTYRYDAFGQPIAQTGSTANAYTYTGRELDASGLYYYRARYYLPSAGRFLTPDPIGLAGGINAYAYVSSNPVNYTDPFGMMAGQAFGPAWPDVGGSVSGLASVEGMFGSLALSTLGAVAFGQAAASQPNPLDPRGLLPDEQWILDRVINTGGVNDLETSRLTIDVGSFWTSLGLAIGFTPGSELNFSRDYLGWSRARQLGMVVHEAWHARQDAGGNLWPGIIAEHAANILPFVDIYEIPSNLNRNFYEFGREQQAVILQNVAFFVLGVPAQNYLPSNQVIRNSADVERLWEEMLSGPPQKK